MKPTSFVLEILLGLSDLVFHHFNLSPNDEIEKDFKDLVQQEIAKEHNGTSLEKLSIIEKQISGIEERISDLIDLAQECVDKQEIYLSAKKDIARINKLLSSTTEVEFYSLDKALKTKIFKAVSSLNENLDILNFENLNDHAQSIYEIKDCFENQKSKDFDPEDEHQTLNNLREVMNELSL